MLFQFNNNIDDLELVNFETFDSVKMLAISWLPATKFHNIATSLSWSFQKGLVFI